MLDNLLISVEAVRGDREEASLREGEQSTSVQDEDLRPREDRGQVQVLVFPPAVAEVQEDDGRNCFGEGGQLE